MEFKSVAAKILSKPTKMKEEEILKLLEVPPNPKMGDLAFPCFTLAKTMKKDPVSIARELSSSFKPSGAITGAEAVGPYLNIFLDWGKVGGAAIEEILKKKDKYGLNSPRKETLMVEYSHPNTHKAFHIGHVRNISLGESLSRILQFNGYKVARTNYQGDIGPHVAKCIWGYLNIYKGKAPKKDRGMWLGKVYAEASQKASNPKVEQEIREINKALYAGDPKLTEVLKKTRKWSLEYFDEIYKDFGAKFDRFYFESEVEGPGIKKSRELLKQGVAKMSEGAILIDLEKCKLSIWILLTQDGTPLYSVKDIILAELQAKEYKPSKIIHVVGSEQNLHFKQLIKTLEMIAPDLAKIEHHLSYGLVNLKSGKMASRMGKVITYEDVKNKLLEKSIKETAKRNPKMSKRGIEEIAKKVALAALKYDMLRTSPEKLIVFDWERALSLEGNTGPYIQYGHTRICSILDKAGSRPGKFDASLLKDPKEKELIKELVDFPRVLEDSARDFRPHYVVNYLYNLANTFNGFYEKCRVIQAETKELKKARLALAAATKVVLKNGLNLLGIDALEKM